MTNAEQLQGWATDTIKMMVNHPESVRVEPLESTSRVALRVLLHPRDVGHVIGKGGRHARALRTIGCIIAANMGTRFTLDVPHEQQSL